MLVAIDWSGRLDDKGQTTWMAVIEDGVFRRLENGRSRPELRDELIRLRGESGALVTGIDFAFGFPQWHATASGWTCGRDIWRAAYRDGETWLTSETVPFWGRTTRRPQHPGNPLRRTEQAAGGPVRSVFQIGGAGAVGTGSVRGMRILHELAEAGFAIWPFDSAGDATIVEIYPRLLTGKVVKSSAQARLQHLNAHYPQDELPALFAEWRRQPKMPSTQQYQHWKWHGHTTRCAGSPTATTSTASRDASGHHSRDPGHRPHSVRTMTPIHRDRSPNMNLH
jgi:hypothetical protein